MNISGRSNIDMINGSIWNKLILFAFPIILSSCFQQLFNAADVAVVGHFAGSHQLAAVGGTGHVVNLLVNLFVGMSIGANVVISRSIGRGDHAKAQRAVPTAYCIALAGGLMLIFIGYFYADTIMVLINTPDEIRPLSVLYLRIYFAGIPFFMIFNFGSAILRAKGDTKRPLYALFCAGIINVLLNLFFVIVFHMGVAGVAFATIIANSLSAAAVTLFLVMEKEDLHLDIRHLKVYREELLEIIVIGIPAGLQGIVFSLSNTCIQSGVNSFGTKAIAGAAAAGNVNSFTYFIINGFSQAAVTFTSQNYGAYRYDRTIVVWRDSMLIGALLCAAASGLIWIFRYQILSIYTTDKEAIEFGIKRMYYVEILHFMIAFFDVTGSCIRGLGKSMLPTALMILGTCVFRLVWVFFVLPVHHTIDVLFLVYPFSWIITMVLVLAAFFIVQRNIRTSH